MLNLLYQLEIIILTSQYLMFAFYFYESKDCHNTVRFGGLSCCRNAHMKPVP